MHLSSAHVIATNQQVIVVEPAPVLYNGSKYPYVNMDFQGITFFNFNLTGIFHQAISRLCLADDSLKWAIIQPENASGTGY